MTVHNAMAVVNMPISDDIDQVVAVVDAVTLKATKRMLDAYANNRGVRLTSEGLYNIMDGYMLTTADEFVGINDTTKGPS